MMKQMKATFNGETPVTGTLEAAGALGTKGDNSVAYTKYSKMVEILHQLGSY